MNCLHTFQRLLYYSTCTSAPTPTPKPIPTPTPKNKSYSNFLRHSLGLSQQQARCISTKLSLRRNKVNYSKFLVKANSVVTLLMQLGFDNTLIRTIVFKEPRLLTCNVDKTLKPKIRALHDQDFSRSDVIRVISTRPQILVYGLESTILPTVQILRQVMGSVSNVVNAIERLNDRYFRNIVKCLLPNVALLTSTYGLPIELIRKQLLYKPGYLVRNPQVFKDIVMWADKKLSEETFESECQMCMTFGANHQSFSNYLVYRLGFSQQQAMCICNKLSQQRKKRVIDSKFVDNAVSVVTLFQKLGFNDALIRHIVSEHPRLLASNVDRTLKPKIRVLQEEGFSGSDIIRVVTRCPAVLFVGMESSTLPAIQIVRQVMGCSSSNVIKTIEKLGESYFRYVGECLLPNVALLRSYGVPIELIRKHILYKPRCYVRNPEIFKVIVMRVQIKLGITRDSPMFLYGLNLISGMTEETFESKFQIFMSFGWTQFDVARLIMRNANCFTFSDELIKKKLDFLMNELELEPAYLTSRAGLIICSLEKRIVPRHKILLILKEKGLLKLNPSLYCAIQMSEPWFLKKFVLPFKEVHRAYSKLTGCSVEMLS